MTRYLLDTNHAGAILRNNQAFLSRLANLTSAELGLCMPSIGELWFMVHNSAQAATNRLRLEALLPWFKVYPFDHSAADEFGLLRADLRRRGTPIPPIDVQIAAIARVEGLTLLTADKHFAQITGLSIENWLTS